MRLAVDWTEEISDMTYENHPASSLFPLMGKSKLRELAANIKENGLLESIELYEGLILDGRNRLAACKLAGVEPRFEELNGTLISPTSYVLSKNLVRRQLTPSQCGAIGAKAVPMLREEAKKRQATSGPHVYGGKPLKEISPEAVSDNGINDLKGPVAEIAGNMVGVSDWTIKHALAVQASDPEAFKHIEEGGLTVNKAYGDLRKQCPSKRQGQIEDAAKRRMVDILSHMKGLSRGLPELKIPALREACTPKEIKTWAGKSLEIAHTLRSFSSTLKGKTNGKKDCQ